MACLRLRDHTRCRCLHNYLCALSHLNLALFIRIFNGSRKTIILFFYVFIRGALILGFSWELAIFILPVSWLICCVIFPWLLRLISLKLLLVPILFGTLDEFYPLLIARIPYQASIFASSFLLSLSICIGEPLFKCGFFQNPVVLVVKLEIFSIECISEHSDYFRVVWSLFKLKFSRIVQKMSELFGVVHAQIINARGSLLYFDLFVLLIFIFGW